MGCTAHPLCHVGLLQRFFLTTPLVLLATCEIFSIKYQPLRKKRRLLCHDDGAKKSSTMLSAARIDRPVLQVICKAKSPLKVAAEKLPTFLPRDVERIKDTFALKLASRIERLPVQVKCFFLFHVNIYNQEYVVSL